MSPSPPAGIPGRCNAFRAARMRHTCAPGLAPGRPGRGGRGGRGLSCHRGAARCGGLWAGRLARSGQVTALTAQRHAKAESRVAAPRCVVVRNCLDAEQRHVPWLPLGSVRTVRLAWPGSSLSPSAWPRLGSVVEDQGQPGGECTLCTSMQRHSLGLIRASRTACLRGRRGTGHRAGLPARGPGGPGHAGHAPSGLASLPAAI